MLPYYYCAREGDEGIPRGGGFQPCDRLDGLLRVYLGQVASAGEPRAPLDQLEGLLDVSGGLELAVDQGDQLGEFIRGVQGGGGGQARLEVGQGYLPDGRRGPFEIQRVVDQLKGLADVRAVQITRPLVFFTVLSEDCCTQARMAHQ